MLHESSPNESRIYNLNYGFALSLCYMLCGKPMPSTSPPPQRLTLQRRNALLYGRILRPLGRLRRNTLLSGRILRPLGRLRRNTLLSGRILRPLGPSHGSLLLSGHCHFSIKYLHCSNKSCWDIAIACMHACMHACMLACMHACVHATHTFMHAWKYGFETDSKQALPQRTLYVLNANVLFCPECVYFVPSQMYMSQ